MTSERSGLYFLVNGLRVTYYFSLVCSFSALALMGDFWAQWPEGKYLFGS